MEFNSPAAFTCNQYRPTSCAPATSIPAVFDDDGSAVVVLPAGWFIIVCITKYPPTAATRRTTTRPTPTNSNALPLRRGGTAAAGSAGTGCTAGVAGGVPTAVA